MNDNHAAAWGILLAFIDVGFLTILGLIVIIAMSWNERSGDTNAKNNTGAEYPPAMTLLRRALLRRCPVCGKGAMFRSYFAMNERCESCGAVFWKNEGEWLGPMVMDYSAAGAAALLSWLVTSWFDLSGAAQFMIPVGATIIVGLAAIPWSRSLWTVFLYITKEMGTAATDHKSSRTTPK
jgi:uncharacterized protein (DUF983 family)